MNYYEHHIGDYAEATAHLTFVEDAAYIRMIRKYYATERPLPADVKQVQRLVGARTKEEREAVESVLQEFFTLQADGWHQARCDADLQRYIAKQEKARASANARWSKPQDERNANASQPYMQTDSERNANASGSHDGRNALQSPVPSNQTPDSRHQTEIQGSVCVNGIPEPPHTHTPIPTEYRDRARTSRPDLNPDAVWQDFCGHYAPDKRTANRWDKWLAREETPGTTGPNGAGMDPDSKGAVTALGIELGLGQWDELKEPFPAYKARVRQVQFQQSSRGA